MPEKEKGMSLWDFLNQYVEIPSSKLRFDEVLLMLLVAGLFAINHYLAPPDPTCSSIISWLGVILVVLVGSYLIWTHAISHRLTKRNPGTDCLSEDQRMLLFAIQLIDKGYFKGTHRGWISYQLRLEPSAFQQQLQNVVLQHVSASKPKNKFP